MKNMLKRLLISFSLVLMLSTSCEMFVDKIDEFDPTQPTAASLGQVINSAEVGIIAFAEGDLTRLACLFSDQFTGVDRQYVSLNEYTTTAGDYDSQWDNIYSTALKSLRIAQAKATVSNNLRAKGLAQILEAYLMGMSAAVWGDIPYTEAVNLDQFPNPAYDTQSDIYADVLTLLDAAIVNIQTSPAGTTYEGDFFGGNDAAWIARANTLKAKYYLHLKQYANAITAATAGISSTSQELYAPHGGSYNQNFNIYYSFLTYDRPGYMSADYALAPKLLDPGYVDAALYRGNSSTDESARFSWYYYPEGLNTPGVAEYDVNVLWSEDWGTPEDYDGFFGAATSFPIITVAENQLILAEAKLRTADFNGALAALNVWRAILNTGYRITPGWLGEGYSYDPYIAADFDPAGIENVDGIDNDDALYREIIEEKYVSLLGTLEVFNDMRRMGFGAFAADQNWEIVGVTPNVGSDIPQRFLIPQTELNSNTSAPSTPPGLFTKTAIFQ